jgi:son of sevenless-like protein
VRFEEAHDAVGYMGADAVDENMPRLKGGTLPKIIERLTYPTYTDTHLVNAFLMTYRSFCTPRDFLELMLERFYVPSPPRLTPAQALVFARQCRHPIQIRVLHVFRGWIDRNYNDLLNDPGTLQTFEDFLDQEQDNDAVSKLVEACIRAVKKCKQGVHTSDRDPDRKALSLGVPAPAPEPCSVAPEDIDILNVSPLEVARQMSRIEHELFWYASQGILVHGPVASSQ